MLSAFIIVFREVLEMAMVLGLLFAATKGVVGTRRRINLGAALGLLGAALVAYFMEALEDSIDGAGEFVFNAAVLAMASLMIAWTVIWMSKHGREMSVKMKQVGTSVVEGDAPMMTLMVVAFAAVMREGSEAVFFLFGAMQAGVDMASMLMGGLFGLAAAGALGLLLYQGLVRIPLKYVFKVMGVLLMLLAAGMASQAANNLVLVEMLPPIIDTLWDTSAWLSQDSLLGNILHVLVGYDEQPSGMQMMVFVLSLTLMAWLFYRTEQGK
ncbi:MAG: FTR1 family protein [Mariprofundaceae bacterium]|nr:FTR1 family protein [Mariprofundaceae bacterium]